MQALAVFSPRLVSAFSPRSSSVTRRDSGGRDGGSRAQRFRSQSPSAKVNWLSRRFRRTYVRASCQSLGPAAASKAARSARRRRFRGREKNVQADVGVTASSRAAASRPAAVRRAAAVTRVVTRPSRPECTCQAFLFVPECTRRCTALHPMPCTAVQRFHSLPAGWRGLAEARPRDDAPPRTVPPPFQHCSSVRLSAVVVAWRGVSTPEPHLTPLSVCQTTRLAVCQTHRPALQCTARPGRPFQSATWDCRKWRQWGERPARPAGQALADLTLP